MFFFFFVSNAVKYFCLDYYFCPFFFSCLGSSNCRYSHFVHNWALIVWPQAFFVSSFSSLKQWLARLSGQI